MTTSHSNRAETQAINELAMALIDRQCKGQKARVIMPAYVLSLAVYFLEHSLDDDAITKIMEAMVKDVITAARLIRESGD